MVAKLRTLIEVFLFFVEGYNRVIFILKDKYGKDLEIVKVYNKEILELLVIFGVDVKVIY